MSKITIGTAPDSWGVWFPSDPEQLPASQFLAEVAEAGYEAIELGPYGYLPNDPAELKEALEQHNLSVLAGTVFSHLHQPDSWDYTWKQVTDVAALTQAVGGEHIVVIPDVWRDHKTGAPKESPTLTDEQWHLLTSGHDELGRRILDEYGLHVQFHSHADSHVGYQPEIDTFPREHRPGVREPVPGHRSRRVLRRRLRRADHHLPRTDRVRPPEAGGPDGGGRGPRQGHLVPRGRSDGSDDRAATRTAGHAARARGPGRPGPRHQGDHRARPLPVRTRGATADREADQDLPEQLQPGFDRHGRDRGGSGPVSDLRVAVLGLGLMGAFHVDLLSTAVKGVTITVVNDFVQAKADDVAARIGARVVADPIAAINDPEVDAVLLATPGSTHAEQVNACLDAGKPVLCEKPLTTDIASSDAIVEKEKALGKQLIQVGFMRRFDPEYAALKQLIVSGGLGNPLMVHCTHRNPSGAGALQLRVHDPRLGGARGRCGPVPAG